MPYTAFLIAVFSALRLGKFNIDPRQSSSFIGMPTPANALFWGSLVVGGHSFLISDSFNAIYLFILVLIMSLLLIAEIPMFSLKFKNLTWSQNKVSYIFLIVCIPLLLIFKISGFAAVIIWYIILSLLTKISTDSKMPMTAMLKPTQLQTHITSQKAIKRRYSVMTKENMLTLRNNNSSPISGYHRLFLKKSFIN